MTARIWFLLILLSLLWGGSFFLVELALNEFGPFTVVAFRIGIGAVALHLFVHSKALCVPYDKRSMLLFLIAGLLTTALPFSFIVWGQQTIEAGRASVLNATTPLFTLLLAHWLTNDEKLSSTKIIGVILGFLGVVLLTGTSSLNPEAVNSLHGQLAVLGAAVCYGFALIFGKRLKHFNPQISATVMLTAATFAMIPIAMFFDVAPVGNAKPIWISVAAVGALGIGCTALAYLIYFEILAKAGSSNLSLVTFLIPLSAIGLGVMFLGEKVGWVDIAGIVLILSGMGIATGMFKQFLSDSRLNSIASSVIVT